MTSNRPYRKGKTPWEVLEELVAQAGKQFDPEVISAFKRVISGKLEKM